MQAVYMHSDVQGISLITIIVLCINLFNLQLRQSNLAKSQLTNLINHLGVKLNKCKTPRSVKPYRSFEAIVSDQILNR